MMSVMKDKRPTCEQFLINRCFWVLNISDTENNVICKELREMSLNELSIGQKFNKYFIKTKLIQKLID
jgi:hypothetical protein